MACGIVEKGPRPPQKHHEDGSLLNPMRELFPSLQIGAGVVDDDDGDANGVILAELELIVDLMVLLESVDLDPPPMA